jgi:hypothetical protein
VAGKAGWTATPSVPRSSMRVIKETLITSWSRALAQAVSTRSAPTS